MVHVDQLTWACAGTGHGNHLTTVLLILPPCGPTKDRWRRRWQLGAFSPSFTGARCCCCSVLATGLVFSFQGMAAVVYIGVLPWSEQKKAPTATTTLSPLLWIFFLDGYDCSRSWRSPLWPVVALQLQRPFFVPCVNVTSCDPVQLVGSLSTIRRHLNSLGSDFSVIICGLLKQSRKHGQSLQCWGYNRHNRSIQTQANQEHYILKSFKIIMYPRG